PPRTSSGPTATRSRTSPFDPDPMTTPTGTGRTERRARPEAAAGRGKRRPGRPVSRPGPDRPDTEAASDDESGRSGDRTHRHVGEAPDAEAPNAQPPDAESASVRRVDDPRRRCARRGDR